MKELLLSVHGTLWPQPVTMETRQGLWELELWFGFQTQCCYVRSNLVKLSK